MAKASATWKRVRFDAMVTSAGATRKARGWRAVDAGVDRYVGLEHLEVNSPKIRRWGSPDGVGENSDVRHFEPGDVILARRGIEQRKVGMAEFRGVASGHALVFRAQPEIMLPEFLPYFLLSDVFMTRALEFSAGSLSKTVNLGALMKQEFALPPLHEQARIQRLTHAVDEALHALRTAHAAADLTEVALVEDLISSATKKVPVERFLEDISYGCSTKANNEGRGLPILRIPNVLRGELDLEDLQWIELDALENERFSVRPGDVLLVRTNGNPDYVGRSVVVPDAVDEMLFASYLLRLRTRSSLLPEYLSAMLNAPSTRRRLRGSVRSSAGNYNINTSGIREQIIPMCSIDEQEQLVSQLREIRAQRRKLDGRAVDALELRRQVLRECLR